MSILEHKVRSVSDSAITGLNRRLFSRGEYFALAEAGIFEGQRIELIEGEIFEMSPIGFAHAAVTEPLSDQLKSAFGSGFAIRNQAPITLGDDVRPSEPQPDITVAVGTWRDYLTRHPQAADIKLVVEVSDSSLSDDRITKGALYAVAGIAEYWIVDLTADHLEVYQDPAHGTYQKVSYFGIGDMVKPLHAASAVDVASFLPT